MRVEGGPDSQGDWPIEPARLSIGVFGVRDIPSTYGGYETFVTALLPKLVERGHEVAVYGRTKETGTFNGVIKRPGRALQSKALETFSHGVHAAIASFRKHDVLLVMNLANVPALSVLRRLGTPCVLNTDGMEWRRGKWGPTARLAFWLASRMSHKAAGALVFDCRAMADYYKLTVGSIGTVIPYAHISLVPTCPPPGVRDKPFVLIAGRHNPENNLAASVRAFLRSGLDVQVVVAGEANYDSPESVELRSFAQNDSRVNLIGHVDDRGEWAWLLQNAAAYIHGHSVGGLNPSLVEAMGLGAFVLALDTPFNREGLGSEGCFFKDFASLTALLEEWLSGGRETDRQLERRRVVARAHSIFELDAVVDAYERVLCSAAEAGAGSRVALNTQW